MIRQQIEKAGGKTYSKQKFHLDKDSSVTYGRLKVNVRADANGEIVAPTPPEMVTRSCVEIPVSLLLDRINSFELLHEGDYKAPEYGSNCDKLDDYTW
ncbi:MAG: hypothetical protein KME64_39170 [Scytonematopsis contorta HA4267-MV1]|jgi:hypothetical protein|nr:hypothetical protein [Scytonematopsis contorta HA4267-MV1]